MRDSSQFLAATTVPKCSGDLQGTRTRRLLYKVAQIKPHRRPDVHQHADWFFSDRHMYATGVSQRRSGETTSNQTSSCTVYIRFFVFVGAKSISASCYKDPLSLELCLDLRSCVLSDWINAFFWLATGLVFVFLGAIVSMPGTFF